MRTSFSARFLLISIALFAFVVPSFSQATAIEPCPAAPTPAKSDSGSIPPTKVEVKSKQTLIDASISEDPGVEKMLGPYSGKVRALNVVIGKLDGDLTRTGIGSGSMGNFVADGMRAQGQSKLGKPVVLSIMNSGGLRKSEIGSGHLRASDIFELLPFENALVALDVSGAQLLKLLQIVTRDAQSGARIKFKWNEQNRQEFISGKLLDDNGHEQEVDPEKLYTIVTIDYLIKLGSGAYAVLQEAKSQTPLNLTLRDAVMDYVKSETAAGRNIRARVDNRFEQVGPGPAKASENPDD
jgi:2',3'-cyclic-nucleotide 2'-phosphodiesterase (5'-nucleotidase family)